MTEHHQQFPDLSGVSQICLDLETRDPHLLTRGVGGVRGDGEVLGFALAWRDPPGTTSMFGLSPGVKSLYFPIAHSEGNMERSKVLDYLDNVLGRGIPVVGANIAYDLEWCRRAGVSVKGPKLDVQVAEALLDENKKTYRLNALAESWLGEKKLGDEMAERCAPLLGCTPKEVIANLARLPASEVEAYARTDAELTLRVMELQAPRLTELGLDKVWDLECSLVDVLQDMRWKGIRLDISKTHDLQAELADEAIAHSAAILELCNMEVNIWSHDDVQAAATKLGLTGLIVDNKGKQSFPAPWLAKQEHPFFGHLLKLRQLSKAGGAFLNSFLELEHNGRLHCQYHQARGDRGGTRSGRLSASLPNLQQIPSRNDELAPRIRDLFMAEERCRLVAFDHSQVEPRITVHYANIMELSGADEALNRYKTTDVDYHQMVADMTGLVRYAAKQMNLGLAYGMGKAKMADMLGLTLAEAEPMFDQYHKGVPFIRALGKAITGVAERRGFVKTILGRRRNFNLFGPPKWQAGMLPLHYEEAVKEWGPCVIRYFTHKAMNSVIQGTAADILKRNMVDVCQEGFLPHLSIHDELVFSLDPGRSGEHDILRIQEIMELPTGIKLSVPLRVDVKTGHKWGSMSKWRA